MSDPLTINANYPSCVAGWKDAEGVYHHLGCREQRPNENPVMVHCGKGTRCATCKNEFG